MSENQVKSNGRRNPFNSLRVRVASAVGARDWETVKKTYAQYGTYLELTGDDTPVDSPVVLTWPHTDENKEGN